MSSFNKDFAAEVLLEAVYTTDEKACAKYGITDRTLRNYRKRLAEDSDFSAFFHTKKRLLDAQWADVLPTAMREAAQTIAVISVAIRTDPMMRKNPFALEKLAGALKLCADVYYTGKVIDARLADQNRPTGQLLGQGTSDEEESAYPN